MKEEQGQRIDKWLWAVRIFKTRSLAADACKKGRVHIGDRPAKPAQKVMPGDEVHVRKPPVTFSFRVKGLTNNRVGAKLVEEYLQNITAPAEYEVLELHRASQKMGRAKGTGRPTKKERRDMEEFFSPENFGWNEPDDFDDFWDDDE